MLGGDWSLNTDFCSAVLRATILEGEVHIITIERGGKREIASWAGLFPPGRSLFGTQVCCTFVDSLQTNQKPLHSEAQRALGYNDFFKKVKPEVKDWITNTVCVFIVLHLTFSLNGDFYISTRNMFPNSGTRYLLKRSVSL